MNSGRTVFAQLIEHLPHKEFHKCVARYRGDRHAKSFSCWDQYLAMAFALRKRLGLEASLYQILQILSLTLFEKTPILCYALFRPPTRTPILPKTSTN